MSKLVTLIICTTLILTSTFSFSLGNNCTYGSIRLQGGRTFQEGRVEICDGISWGTVCDDFFTNIDARVVCSQLGFSDRNARALYSGFNNGFLQPILLDNVQCNGTEDRLIDCNARPIGTHNCRHFEDVGVTCTSSLQGDIRLRGRQIRISGRTSGRVEVFNGSAWGTVCDDFWSQRDAEVACRQLGFQSPGARALTGGVGYSRVSGDTSIIPIVLDNLLCTGPERRLADCPNNGIGVHNCVHNEDAGVECSTCTSSMNAIIEMFSMLDDKKHSNEVVIEEDAKYKKKENILEKMDMVDETVDVPTDSPVTDQVDVFDKKLLSALKDLLMEEK